MSKQWFVVRGGAERGPFTAQRLKEMVLAGELNPEDQVRREDMQTPRPASTIKGLFPTEGATPVAAPTEAAPLPRSRSSPGAPEAEPKPRGLKKALVIAVGVVAVLSLGSCVVVGVLFTQSKKAAQQGLADADKMWEAGDKAAAVSKYKAILQDRSKKAALGDGEKSLVYGRLIDDAVERGDRESAKNLIAEALSAKVSPQLEHPEARAMLGVEAARVSAAENRTGQPQDRNKFIAEVEASTSVPVTAFADDEYKYDFSSDDYDAIPVGAKRETRKRVIKGGAEGLSGKRETMAGYVNSAGQFVEHGTYTTWADEGETKKLREGKMLNGKLHGLTTFYHPSGKKRWETVYVNDKKHGVARSWYENGQQEDENPSSNGLTHGRFRQWYESGEPKTDETWVRGKQHGLHKKWWKGGGLAFVGCFREGKRYGKLYSWNEDGSPAESGEWDGDRPQGKCRLAFKGGDQKFYFVEADDGDWKGGTTAEFIARMYYFSLKDRPGVQLQFDPRARIANYYSASAPEFVGRFGSPSQDAPDVEKSPANAPPRIRDQYRKWTYRCRDGEVVLSVQPTQTGSLLVTVRP